MTSRYIVAPKLKMSVRSLTILRFAVSGAMYSGVPWTRAVALTPRAGQYRSR